MYNNISDNKRVCLICCHITSLILHVDIHFTYNNSVQCVNKVGKIHTIASCSLNRAISC